MGMDRSERRAAVKGGIDKEDCRKNRAQQKVELRKAKRDEGLQKRRNLNLVVVDPSLEPDVEPESADASTPTGAPQQSFEELVQTTLRFIASNGAPEEFDAAFAATRALRKQLSLAKNPPIDEVGIAASCRARPLNCTPSLASASSLMLPPSTGHRCRSRARVRDNARPP